ncbi:MAG TPA: S41 family peptidase [Rhabdochlamydiaceae bacterium]|nr:S41 family peptidase [Rhabdochlamydiaceae bacterium]
MARISKLAFITFFLLSGTLLFPEVKQLKTANVKETMDELLSYHVEYKELSPLIIRRAFKNYVEQFDRSKIYLLDSEIHAYIHLSDEKALKVIANFKNGDLSDFAELNLTLQRAVLRAQKWRGELAKELALFDILDVHSKGSESQLGYAATETELKARIRVQLIKLLLEEKKLHGFQLLTSEQKTKIFQLWERRFQKKENPYLIVQNSGVYREKGEHAFCLHVLKASTKSLDAHSAYFSPEEAEEMRMSLEKQFEGIGIILREGIDGIFIIEMIKGSPAEKSGKLLPGDRIIEIDREPIVGLSFDEVLAKMKGKKPDIVLKVERKKQEKTAKFVTVPLKREKIILNDERLNYTFEPFGDGIIGKINLTSFYESGAGSSAEKDLREAIKDLKQRGKLLGIVLDFRENSGGFLSQAVKVASLFILRGVIVVSKYAQGEVKYMRDLDGRLYFEGPVIILTSKASASAAEIVAGALQDYGAALIVGDERTYGKGTIQYQTVTETDAKAYYKVTVGRYYTVSGRSAQIEGIKADIVVPTELANYNIGERFLEYPLANDRMPPFYDDLGQGDEKNWLQKNYLPNPKLPIYPWQKMVPTLAQNSTYRINKDKNFSLFLKNLNSEQSFKMPKSGTWGIGDLQLTEAVHILKDVIIMLKAENALPLTQK